VIVVLDTNVVVSGVFFHGPPAAIVEHWLAGRFDVYATPAIVEEYLRVIEDLSTLKAPHFTYPWEEILLARCHLIPDAPPRLALPRDPADEKFLECARRVGAQYLVSGDRDLQAVEGPLEFTIVSPRQFLQQL